MLAHHPITGKEIRIIQSDTSLWKEKKTLYYSPEKSVKGDTIHTEGNPTFLVCLENVSAQVLKEKSKQSLLLFVTKKCVDAIGVQTIKSLQITNLLVLEELHEIYPYIGGIWDGTLEDAVIICCSVLRYKYIHGLAKTPRMKTLDIQEETKKPSELVWITQFYIPDKNKRRREIETCLRKNVESQVINRIILLNEKKEALPVVSNKIEERVIGKRLTYADVLEVCSSLPEDTIVAFANADICIDDASWKDLWSVSLEDKCLALLRYDLQEDGSEPKLFGPRADSQDTWVVRAGDVKKRGDKILQATNFKFGQMGCDNAFALEMFKQKFLVVNPAISLKTFHYHTSGVRNYDKHDVIEKAHFLYIHPTGFHDVQPITRFTGSEVESFTPQPLHRLLRGPGAQNFAEKMNKTLGSDDTSWKPTGTNTVTLKQEHILHVKDCFQSDKGLLYDKQRMYIGPGAKAQKVWSESYLRSLTPTIACKKGLVVPFDEKTFQSRERYILHYLSKVMLLREKSGSDSEFFCPEQKEIVDALQLFNWNAKGGVPLLKYEPNTQVWCQEAYAMAVSENTQVSSEEISVLRKYVKGWSPRPEQFSGLPRIVLIEDGKVLTSDLVYQLEEVLERAFDVKVVYPDRTSTERMWDCMRGAWAVIQASNTSSWNWLLPKGAFVYEVTNEYTSTGIDISVASMLEHRFIQKAEQNLILDEVFRDKEESFRITKEDTTDLPVVWLPRKDLEGYFSHAGDSFREMARLWGKQGYCVVKEHPTATMCWWNEVGEKGVLLYDRPNHDWRLAAPLVEKEYQNALFGNPKVPTGVKGSPWFFWPRRPELVEELVSVGAHEKGYAERKEGIVFYGKIENKVQEKRRTTEDWKSACVDGEWIMVKGEEKYPFTQLEYLKRLSSARFGLCLAGYGLKCHREVECMAMGCVPIVAPECDMDSYLEPPVEGVHYIRVTSPEEARKVALTMSETTWKEMSIAAHKWWKRNCSCEGSFNKTSSFIKNLE